jgi:hypothetical protein
MDADLEGMQIRKFERRQQAPAHQVRLKPMTLAVPR